VTSTAPSVGSTPGRWVARVMAAAFLAALLIVLGTFIVQVKSLSQPEIYFGWAAATFIFGALVGFAEILSRYRDEPLLATFTNSGMTYLAINGAISTIAFATLRRYPTQIFSGLNNDLMLTAMVAGFGAMAVFRSKFFSFKSSDGTEVPIGPAIVLDTILKMIDQKIDRHRATARQTRVFEAMFGITDFSRTADYVVASLNSFQNLSGDDKKAISDGIKDLKARTDWSGALKSLALGFMFLTVAGDENFDVVVANIKKYLSTQQTPKIQQPPVGPQTPGEQ
jgi:multisubunit Na+/H+ antiporter MnhC subunit